MLWSQVFSKLVSNRLPSGEELLGTVAAMLGDFGPGPAVVM